MSPKTYIENHKDRFIEELIEWLKIPSISADSKYKNDVRRAAEYVKNKLENTGIQQVSIFETAGHPIVYAEKIIDPKLPTVMVYGHYDVQPPDPLDLWNSPPFEPIIKNEKIYARGACDDKGQVYMHVKALEILLKTNTLPCNIKIMIEGEEEIGSSHLEEFVQENKEKLACDIILISDTAMIANDVPSMDTGMRGLCYLEITITGPNRDLHSGVYGGAVANPINVLSKMIASLHDENGRITIPHFYDDVQELSENERKLLSQNPFDEDSYKKDLGIQEVFGEKDYTTTERASIRPTLDINGIWGGYIGEGAKTVLPSKAYAKLSMRLVPNQDWKKITTLFSEHFKKNAPKTITVEIQSHHGGAPYVTDIQSLAYQAAEKAMHETFGKKPIPTRGGGSIPIVALFEKELGAKTIFMGFGLDSDAIHSPNEHFGVFNYLKGIETITRFYDYYRK